jgi:hypothetical protein
VFTTGVAYDPMQLTVSQHYMAYSSFPPSLEEERRHWLRQEYVAYLGRFRQRFGLDQHIRLGADPEMAREVILRLPVVRDAVDLALVPLALAGRVEESAIPKIHEIIEQQFVADTQLM